MPKKGDCVVPARKIPYYYSYESRNDVEILGLSKQFFLGNTARNI
ncbi:hypothetical protein A1E_03825 [Rickettsia canadensis str. McKiel]|uniref:Uncharacterized protein n=2 Tax=Rickettsia canadensis TaxID=788 RepID=A8EZB1_RICCK|nr:hypothetical protein A1E_03825 [Rickettsia canadensis str. McKiel]AFB21257.1 hypothetical protein RCA_03480 [Rickettsia canadensis str. CA410]